MQNANLASVAYDVWSFASWLCVAALGVCAVVLILRVCLRLWRRRGRFSVRGLVELWPILLCGAFMAVAAFYSPSPRPKRNARGKCMSHMHAIARALEAYHSVNGSYPPAYVADKDGRPLYSWRVLLLPYLDRADLYSEFHRDEPWDSPHNRALLNRERISTFVCLSEWYSGEAPENASYVRIVGPGTACAGRKPVRKDDITDGLGSTLLLVEMSDSGIHWAEPRDLDVSEMSYCINNSDHPCIRSRHDRGAMVVFCDGRVEFLKNETAPDTVEALTTVAGGEKVDKDGY